jgi:hypothetical protein
VSNIAVITTTVEHVAPEPKDDKGLVVISFTKRSGTRGKYKYFYVAMRPTAASHGKWFVTSRHGECKDAMTWQELVEFMATDKGKVSYTEWTRA